MNKPHDISLQKSNLGYGTGVAKQFYYLSVDVNLQIVCGK